ncbi:2179_t:CDS:2 [Funneliformis geosporum]|uniref:13979_t:CDS:1 n=1 Tax=Funneliformis geosporum TaxID=1117311 RepID=A0A9W4SLG4_9GLOM|nr:13979_t:CDS:2 [Funneliformis geosporum]CAI2179861.1 2179_t:CDS:2 [Funneliformis geosporum]
MGGTVGSKIKLLQKQNYSHIKEKDKIDKIDKITINSLLNETSTKFPSTSKDIDFLHQYHFTTKLVWTSNFSSPIEKVLSNGATVLDVSCGAGTYLLDLSSEYIFSEFVGVDKNQLFPTTIKPNNVNFFDVSVEKGLLFQDNYFDFVHLSIIEPLYDANQWDFIIDELLRVTKPGGWVEVRYDYEEKNIGSNFLKFIKGLVKLFVTNHIEFLPQKYIKSVLSTDTRIEISKSENRKVKLGKHSDKTGILFEQLCSTFFTDVLGEMLIDLMDFDDINELNQEWKKTLKEFDEDKTIVDAYRIYAMKKN